MAPALSTKPLRDAGFTAKQLHDVRELTAKPPRNDLGLTAEQLHNDLGFIAKQLHEDLRLTQHQQLTQHIQATP